MESSVLTRNTLLSRLVSRSFPSAAVAADELCRLVRAELDVDLAYASHSEGGLVEYLAVDERVPSGLSVGGTASASPEFAELLLAGPDLSSATTLTGSPFDCLAWPGEAGLTSYAMTVLADSSGRPTGVLAVLDRGSRTFTDGDLALLQLLGGILAREKELEQARASERLRGRQLEVSEQRYRSLVDDLGDIVVETDATGAMTYVNRAFSDLVGFSVDHGSWDMMAYVHPDDRVIAEAQVAAALSGDDTIAAAAAQEVRFCVPDGSTRWMSVRGRPMFDEQGGYAGLRGIIHDVTVRVEAERSVRAALTQTEAALAEAERARDEAERASRAKSEFLSRMSHELRTPLNAILGFGQLLELNELVGEDGENVQQIMRAGRHLLDLINEVLDVVRIESGDLGLLLEPVEVGDVLSECLDLVRTAAQARGLSLRTPDRLDGSMVVADRQRLKQILVNLLSNAVKYNRDGGDVAVTWTAHADTADQTTPNGWLRVLIQDTGPGIPPDRLDDLFTPFDRLGAENSDIEGSGIGLSLTKTLVAALGGRIGVTSELGRGATFWFDLPAVPPADPPGTVEETESTSTVLYIEDNPANITLVRRVLARRPQVRLEVVQDGGEAIEAAERIVPDLVLLDLHLPGLPGETVLSLLRTSADARLREVPIIVVTADLTAGTERRMLDAGATLFLSKPIDVLQMLAVVDDLLVVR